MADKIEISVLERKHKKPDGKVYYIEVRMKSYPVTPLSLAEAEIGEQIEKVCDIILEDLAENVNNSGVEITVKYIGKKKKVQ